MSGQLTTHVLDTARGCPAAGIAIRLHAVGPYPRHICSLVTNSDGRGDAPLLEGGAFAAGRYELEFSLGTYFALHFAALPDPPFLDDIVIRFGISASDQHYHVPLLVSPYGYSTYRGS